MNKSGIKIDFVNFSEYFDESISYPMGILYISACLKRHGFTNIGYVDHICMLRKIQEYKKPDILHSKYIYESMPDTRKGILEDLLGYLEERQPHIILLGPIMTFHLIELVDLLPRLRQQHPNSIILAGGPHFGKEDNLDEELLENCIKLDGVAVGEAEETIVEVATRFYIKCEQDGVVPSRVEFKSELSGIAGIRIRGKTLQRRAPPELKDLPSPDMGLLEQYWKNPKIRMPYNYSLSKRRNPIVRTLREVYVGDSDWGSFEEDISYLDPYRSRNERFPFGVIIGSRGCPYNCGFCNSSGNRRVHTAEYVFNQITELNKQYGIRQFIFFDPLFTTCAKAEQERIKNLCLMILRSGLVIRYIIDIRADIILKLPEELLALMMRSGCAEFNLGLEKGSDKLLREIAKKMITETHRKAITKLRNVAKSVDKEIVINGTFILGGPGETKSDVRDTLLHCLSLHLDEATLYILEICPGTRIYQEALKEGILESGLAPYLNAEEYPQYATQTLPHSFLNKIKKQSAELFSELEELKKYMREAECQFLPEEQRNTLILEYKKTKTLHDLIERCIENACDHLRKYPNKGLSKNGQIASPITQKIRQVEKEIFSIEKQLVQKYPNYVPNYEDYQPGTLISTWKLFIKLLDGLFSMNNFGMRD